MKKSFRSKNILLVVILALLVFVGGNIYFSNPDNLARLEVGNNPHFNKIFDTAPFILLFVIFFRLNIFNYRNYKAYKTWNSN